MTTSEAKRRREKTKQMEGEQREERGSDKRITGRKRGGVGMWVITNDGAEKERQTMMIWHKIK